MNIKLKQLILSKLPAKQSDLSKVLNIDKRIISKIVLSLEKDKLISRKKVSAKGITTYIIQRNVKLNISTASRISQLNPKYNVLLNERKQFNPCTACMDLCQPTVCEKLNSWIL